MIVNLEFSNEEIETMRTLCYRHWIAKYESKLVEAAWDMNNVDDFPNGGWANAVYEDIANYWVRNVVPVQPSGVE